MDDQRPAPWHVHEPSDAPSTEPGDVRDAISTEKDLEAAVADAAARRRDVEANGRDEAEIERETARGAVDKAAAQARYWALRNRLDAAADRVHAANMRTHALSDRIRSADDRHRSSIDELTGTYRRGPGLIELARDLVAVRRTGQSMVLGFLDVDELKKINDTQGHTAGDAVLRSVSKKLRRHLRPHDLVVRYGGDEFVFSVAGGSEADIHERMDAVNNALIAAGHNSITYGLVTLTDSESLSTAISRADHALYDRRRQRSNGIT